MKRRTFLTHTGLLAFGAWWGNGCHTSTVRAEVSRPSSCQFRLKTHLDKLVATGNPPCIGVVASHRGKEIAAYWTGHALPKDASSPVITPDTRFNIGSVTKPVTASLVFKLIEEGRLKLDDKVIAHIPEFPYEDVTLLHLMLHTSGYDSKQGVPWPTKPDQVSDYFSKIYALKPRQHKLDEVCSYWTAGYSVLMDVIQRVAKEPIESYAQRVLFEPLEMTSTHYDITKVPEDRLILPCNEKGLLEDLRHAPSSGDSGLLTTAEDLVKFGQAVMTGKNRHGKCIFKPQTVECMLTECTQGRFKRTPLFFYHGSSEKASCFGQTASPQAVGHPGFSGCCLILDPVKANVVGLTSNGVRFHEDWSNYGNVCDVLFGV